MKACCLDDRPECPEFQGLLLSAEFREDQQTSRPSAETDGGQTAAGQRSAGGRRGETQEGEGIRE